MMKQEARAMMNAVAHDSRIGIYRRLARKYDALATAVENGTYASLSAYHTTDQWVDCLTLAVRLDITTQAANNRVKHLCELGICERRFVRVEGGGRRFEYRWIHDWNGA